eukprot:TRINITY_DN21373_c0_g1_i2.p1 TRINITY_DN21373_c0_g1~~TRINITY_DN21373_c0_g1_i2.p1  ORF type:complete len:651 (+),score=80.93 TRINITY_DN21373_c0_g1_i2:184-1953(+)
MDPTVPLSEAELAAVYARFVGSPDCGRSPARSFAVAPRHSLQPPLQTAVRAPGVYLLFHQAVNALAWLGVFACGEAMTGSDQKVAMRLWPRLAPRQDGRCYFPDFCAVVDEISSCDLVLNGLCATPSPPRSDEETEEYSTPATVTPGHPDLDTPPRLRPPPDWGAAAPALNPHPPPPEAGPAAAGPPAGAQGQRSPIPPDTPAAAPCRGAGDSATGDAVALLRAEVADLRARLAAVDSRGSSQPPVLHPASPSSPGVLIQALPQASPRPLLGGAPTARRAPSPGNGYRPGAPPPRPRTPPANAAARAAVARQHRRVSPPGRRGLPPPVTPASVPTLAGVRKTLFSPVWEQQGEAQDSENPRRPTTTAAGRAPRSRHPPQRAQLQPARRREASHSGGSTCSTCSCGPSCSECRGDGVGSTVSMDTAAAPPPVRGPAPHRSAARPVGGAALQPHRVPHSPPTTQQWGAAPPQPPRIALQHGALVPQPASAVACASPPVVVIAPCEATQWQQGKGRPAAFWDVYTTHRAAARDEGHSPPPPVSPPAERQRPPRQWSEPPQQPAAAPRGGGSPPPRAAEGVLYEDAGWPPQWS